jgi:outer membrane lipoprotein carrier protein
MLTAGRGAAVMAAAEKAAESSGAVMAECRDRAARAVQSRYDGVRDVSARFEQTTRPASLGSAPSKPLVSRGRVVLAKPGRMRWTYEEPEPSLVVSDGDTLWLFDPTFGEVQKIPAGEGFLTGAAAQFLLGAGDMRRDFEVTAVSCQASEAELELVPRQPASYEKLFLLVDPSNGDVHGTRIVDLLGNVVSVELRDLRFNRNPSDSEFRFQTPDGVKVIEISP